MNIDEIKCSILMSEGEILVLDNFLGPTGLISKRPFCCKALDLIDFKSIKDVVSYLNKMYDWVAFYEYDMNGHRLRFAAGKFEDIGLTSIK